MSDETPAGLEMAKWAIEHLGCKVIPAYCNRHADKYPLIREWQNRGTRDHGQLEEWWDNTPFAFPGLLGGKDSGLLVIDADGPDAVGWLRSFVMSHGGISEGVFVAKTPGRGEGVHLYYRWPEWLADMGSAKVRNSEWSGGEVDLRGRGTWTLMPGSHRPDGEYQVIQAPEKLDEFPREMWLAFAEVSEQSIGSGGGTGNSDLRSVSPEEAWGMSPVSDGRKSVIAGLAWYLSIRGATEEEVVNDCCHFAAEGCFPPLERVHAERRARYAWGRAQKVIDKQNEETSKMAQYMSKLFG